MKVPTEPETAGRECRGDGGSNGTAADGSTDRSGGGAGGAALSQMTLEDKIAQMFVITPNALTGYASGVTAAGDTTKEAYQEPSGGRNCVYGGQPHRPGADDHHALQYAGRLQGSAPDFRYFYVWMKKAAVSRASPAMMPSG